MLRIQINIIWIRIWAQHFAILDQDPKKYMVLAGHKGTK